MATSALLVAVLGVALWYPAAAAAAHPIAGVITLLEDLEVQTQKEGAAEAEGFQKFQYWCKRSTRRLTRYIAKEKEAIDEYKNKIDGLSAEIETLDVDIKKQEKNLEVLDKQEARAEKLRKKEHKQYKKEVKNLDTTIDATDETIVVMEEEEQSTFLQRDPELLKKNPGKDNPFKPKAKTFSHHAGGVIETFKKLEDGWSIDKLSEEEQETNALNAYKLAKQARDQATKTATDAKDEKESIKSGKESDKATTESDLAEMEKRLSGDSTTLDDTDKDCKTKNNEFDERSKIRAGELEAMAMAKKILSKVSGVRNPDTHVIPSKSLFQAHVTIEQDTSDFEAAVSLLQVNDPKAKAVNLLRKAATSVGSRALEKLAQTISTYDGPFDKIKAMIQKMVFRLMAEQKDEDEHKLWCDLETEKSNDAKDEKTDKVDMLQKKIAEMDGAIKVLVKKIAENDEKAESVTQYMKEETSFRDKNHAEIEATIKDSVDAQNAITEAISVLKEFYKSSGMIPKEPWEFVQTGSRRDVELPDKPATWDASYTGTTDPNNGAEGILTILDKTMEKFTTMEADAKVEDETDQKNYEQDMAAQQVELDETAMDTQMKTSKKDSLQEKMEGTAQQLKHASGELNAVKDYLKDLEPACGSGDSSYEDRKKARADETEALKKAQTILEDAFKAKAFLERK